MKAFAALASASVVLADVALAATGSGSVGEEVGGEPQASGGMPQLDPTYFPSQIFWLAVSFGVLYWLFAKFGVPRVADILETRQDRIAADLDRAQSLRSDAEAAIAEHERLVAEAQAKARAQLDAAIERLKAEAARQEADLDRSLQRQLADADARIRASRDEALNTLEEVASEVSRAAVSRLVGIEIDAGEAAEAVASARRKAA